MRPVAVGSKVPDNKGICMIQYGSDPFHGPVAVDVLSALLRRHWRSSPDRLLLSVRNLGLPRWLACPAGARGWRQGLDVGADKMRRQYGGIGLHRAAAQPHPRGHQWIRPLAEIIEQITELVSFKLKGAPAGARSPRARNWATARPKLGRVPHRSGKRFRRESAPRSAPCLSRSIRSPNRERSDAKHCGWRSRFLPGNRNPADHSDLRHRSEFDLLTDTHNRFSLDRHLDTLIAGDGRMPASSGSIYVDLDEFKQVNDAVRAPGGRPLSAGGRVGMKRQLRPATCWRAWAAMNSRLVPVVRSRAHMQEIAQRLEHCFDEPIPDRAGISFSGSAKWPCAFIPKDGPPRTAC